ncbi:hypothetical protein EUGRSUZ_H04270 [Eucalyptus grandis]|uniref:Uncharacterized protein n=2 Tax=Eucalyptus grandis TaxID=71139 RepID=A0ACC3JWB1_EUCGR|nr:hypothetical protein EUGRSUZ_H04270 [Eucalyptus grandis]
MVALARGHKGCDALTLVVSRANLFDDHVRSKSSRSPSSLATYAGLLQSWPPLPLPSRATRSQEPRRSWLAPNHLRLGLFSERGHPKAHCLPPSLIASAVIARSYLLRRAPLVVAASQALTFSACASSVIEDTQKLTRHIRAWPPLPLPLSPKSPASLG